MCGDARVVDMNRTQLVICATHIRTSGPCVARTARCKALLIATYNGSEGELRPHILDRFACQLEVAEPQRIEERVTAVQSALAFQDAPYGLEMAAREETDLACMRVG
jgi:Mg-chelatase subunit ChlI